MTELDIQRVIIDDRRRKYKYALMNCWLYPQNWELDLFEESHEGFFIEDEIKISKSDFNHEFKYKLEKHEFIKDVFIGKERDFEFCPNYFNIVCPDKMINVDEIPDYCGLIYVIGNKLKKIKEVKIHNKIQTLDVNKLLYEELEELRDQFWKVRDIMFN